MFEQITDIYCPECGDRVEDIAPEHWLVPGEVPGYRHVADRTPLCPVMTRSGYYPAEPVERPDENERREDEAGASGGRRRPPTGPRRGERHPGSGPRRSRP